MPSVDAYVNDISGLGNQVTKREDFENLIEWCGDALHVFIEREAKKNDKLGLPKLTKAKITVQQKHRHRRSLLTS